MTSTGEDFNLKRNTFGFEPIKDPSTELVEKDETTLVSIHTEIAEAIDIKDPDKLATSYNKLISHVKKEGDEEFVVQNNSPKSVRENANTYLEWSKRMPEITTQKAAVLLTTQEQVASTNTMDQKNQIHGANKDFRQDPLVIEDSHLAATALVGFLAKYESPYFSAATSEQKIATDTLSPHTVDVFLGKKRPAIVLD